MMCFSCSLCCIQFTWCVFYVPCVASSLIDLFSNRQNGPQYQCVGVLCAFFNRGNTEGTNSVKILCLVFFCVCFVWICVGKGFVDLRDLWLDCLCAEWVENRFKFVFSPDVVLCVFSVTSSLHYCFFSFPLLYQVFMMCFPCLVSFPVLPPVVMILFSFFPMLHQVFIICFSCSLCCIQSSWFCFPSSPCCIKSSWFVLLVSCVASILHGVFFLPFLYLCCIKSSWFVFLAHFVSSIFMFCFSSIGQHLFSVCSEGECLNTNSSSRRPEYATRTPLPSILVTQRVCTTW